MSTQLIPRFGRIHENVRLATSVLLVIVCGIASTHLWANQDTDGSRTVWEYKGGFGPTWFVHEGNKKWVLYRGDGRTFLYVDALRTPEHIELRGPYTELLIRLSKDRFETRRTHDQPWRKTATGKWVAKKNLPTHIRAAPKGYQVRLVYFVPPDREPAEEYEAKIRFTMSMVAELLHDDLRSKNLRPKRLEFESQEGEILVHLVRAKEKANFYTKDAWPNTGLQAKRIHDELLSGFGDSKRHVTIVFAETYSEQPVAEAWSGHIALGSAKPPDGGFAVYFSWVLKDLFSATTREEQVKLFFDQTPIRGRKAFGSRQKIFPDLNLWRMRSAQSFTNLVTLWAVRTTIGIRVTSWAADFAVCAKILIPVSGRAAASVFRRTTRAS